MRLALISTPRSGNTWLRGLLAGLYGLEQRAVHDPDVLDWATLPARCIVQVHWHRTDALVRTLAASGFRPVVIARHPLDVLISILHFCSHSRNTRHWLLGAGGDESAIQGARPSDPVFTSYMTGGRAQALLSVTPAWWSAIGAVTVRYEDLALATIPSLARLAEVLGPPLGDAAAVASSNSLSALRSTSTNQHFWQGTPGLWKRLLSRAQVQAAAQAYREVFSELGYAPDQVDWPDDAQIASDWDKLA